MIWPGCTDGEIFAGQAGDDRLIGPRLLHALPVDRLLPETDGPFGMVKGVPLAPGGGGLVYRDLSKLKGISSIDSERIMTANFRRLVAMGPRNRMD